MQTNLEKIMAHVKSVRGCCDFRKEARGNNPVCASHWHHHINNNPDADMPILNPSWYQEEVLRFSSYLHSFQNEAPVAYPPKTNTPVKPAGYGIG